jgi:hypothetical protein
MQARLQWDLLTSPWTKVEKRTTREGNVIFDLKPPVGWRFDTEMLNVLNGQVALEQTRVQVEVRDWT